MSSFCTREAPHRVQTIVIPAVHSVIQMSSVILSKAKNLEPNAETDIKNRKNITERKNHISKQKSLAAGYCLKRDVAVPWPKKPKIWER